MKKGIIVLLIAVLVAGVAFAADAKFTGYATIGYEAYLDSKTHGIFNDPGMEFSVKFEFSTAEGGSTGEGKIYAEIAADADFSIELKKKTDGAAVTPTLSAEITKANIVAGDLTINILGPEGAYDYAAIYITNKLGKPIVDRANNYTIDDHGFVVTYKDFSVAFSYYHTQNEAFAGTPATEYTSDPYYIFTEDYKDAKYVDGYDVEILAGDPALDDILLIADANGKAPSAEVNKDALYVGAQTPAFAVADGLTVQAGANFKLDANHLTDVNTINVGGGAVVKFAPEDSKLSASFAADAAAVKTGDADAKIPVDIAASAKYDFVSADIYFGTKDKFDENQNTLAAKVSAKYGVTEQITVSGSAEAYWATLSDATKPILCFTAGLNYKADSLAAYVKGEVTLQNGADGYELKPWTYVDGKGGKYRGLGISAGVSSTAIIDNATVALDWAKADFAKKGEDKVQSLGEIKASVTVAF